MGMSLSAFQHTDIHIHRDVLQNTLVQVKLVTSRTMIQHILPQKVNKEITEKEMCHKLYLKPTTFV